MDIYRIGDCTYEEKVDTWRLAGWKAGTPENGKVEVQFAYENILKSKKNYKLVGESQYITREFYYMTNEDVAKILRAGLPVNLSFTYMKDFSTEKIRLLWNENSKLPSFKGKYCCFDGEAIFDHMDFQERVDFTGAIAGTAIFRHCNFQNNDKLKFKFVNNLKILDCVVAQTLQITGAEILSLKDTISLGYIYCDWEKNSLGNAILSNEETMEEKGRQFSLMKQDYHKIGSYENEDKAFVEYMRCRRERLKNSWMRALDKLIDCIGGYGTKPSHVAITMLVVWGVFGGIFTGLDLIGGGLSHGLYGHWIDGFYFSGITFLTIGYGDIAPMLVITKILAPIEGALGLFLMSYFTISVVRRTLR